MRLDEAVNFRLGYYKRARMFECDMGGAVIDILDKQVCVYATDKEHTAIYCALVLGDVRGIRTSPNLRVFFKDGKIVFDLDKCRAVIDFEKRKCSCTLPNVRAYGSDEWGECVFEEWTPFLNALFDQ